VEKPLSVVERHALGVTPNERTACHTWIGIRSIIGLKHRFYWKKLTGSRYVHMTIAGRYEQHPKRKYRLSSRSEVTDFLVGIR
jgi:hypothetical protein